jgi:LacI family transcriptional regulator
MTIKELAKKAGVSVGTVDRVINNRGHVSEEKRIIIEQIIKEFDYKPNLYARNLRLNQIIKIGFITPNLNSEDGYWNLVHQGVIKAQEDFMDLSFKVETFEYDRGDPSSFIKATKSMMKTGVVGCVIIPKCIKEAKDFISSHPELKVVLVDSPLPRVDSIVCMVGQNPFQGGIIAGKVLSLLQPNAEKLLTFSFKDSYMSNERIRGFKKYYSNCNQCEIIELKINKVAEIPKIVKEVYSQHKFIDAVFSPCSLGYLLGREISYLGHRDETKIVTFDLIPENRNAIRYGLIDCILSQRPVYQGYSGVYQLYRYLVKKQEIEKDLSVELDILFPENLPNDYNDDTIGRLNPYCIPLR